MTRPAARVIVFAAITAASALKFYEILRVIRELTRLIINEFAS